MANLKKIRIGTDAIIALSVNISGKPVTWSEGDIRHVYAFSDVQGQPVAEMSHKAEGQTLRCTYAAKDQNYTGPFRVIVEFADGKAFSSSLDVPAFEIVRTTEEADADTGEVVLDIDGTMRFYSLSEAIAKIEAATKVATDAAAAADRSAGNADAKAKAANDAAEKANAAAQAAGATNTGIAKAEEQRVNAENARKEAELARADAEKARVSAEGKRADAEAKRAEAEVQRAAGEQSRVNAETGRVNAESARVKAESARANDEATRAANEEQRQNNEKARSSEEAVRVEAEKGRVAAESARVAEFARLKTESETATKNATDAAEEAKEVSSGVAALERDLGQYAELPSVAMTAETTGKYINADGEFVDDADFNIAAIGAVVVGNTYELYMGGADKMKLGVALFVARIKTTTTSGVERIEYVPLFSAMSTDIPKSGYVCFEAMEAYSDVLVCYRADVPEAATLLVRRYGTKASIATQINNLRKEVDLKSFADGYYESMRVGTADNLTSKGDATEEVIMSRKAGGDNQIEDGSASIKRIKGVSFVLNQSIGSDTPWNGVYGTTKKTGISISYTYTKIGDKGLNQNRLAVNVFIRNAHKYLISFQLTTSKEGASYLTFYDTKVYTDKQSYTAKIGVNKIATILTATGTGFSDLRLGLPANETINVGDTVSIEDIMLLDLTQMFGINNEPSTPDDFAKRLGYSSIDDVPYIPYNEGEIVSSFAEGIKTTDTDGKVSERKWSDTLKKYFPDGLKSVISVYDEITPTKAAKRVSSIRFIDIRWQGYTISSTGLSFFYGKIPGGQQGLALCDKYPTRIRLDTSRQNDCYITTGGYIGPSATIIIVDQSFASLDEFINARKDSIIHYMLESPEEIAYDELNLTEQVAEGGTEEAIITDGKTSTPLHADIVYPIDAYNTIKANKTNIGTLSSLNTASKTDLVSAINELAGKVAALEAKATEVTNETTE
nr:MAG TPA: MAEBL protein [Caudoviricetes sp.]